MLRLGIYTRVILMIIRIILIVIRNILMAIENMSSVKRRT